MLPKVLRLSRCLQILALLVIASLPAWAAQAPAVAPTPRLTLQECIARALRKNFDLKIQGYDTSTALDTLAIAKAGYDPSFNLSASKSVNQADAPATSLVGTRSDSVNTRVGVNQQISTGATIGLSSALNRNGSNNSYATLNPAYNADLSLSISQPLLKNAGTAVNLAAINKAKIGVTIANLNYKSRLLQVVYNTESAYYDLVFAREQLKVRQLSLDLAQKLLDENQTKKDTGVATDLDVLQAQVGVATARNNVVLAEKTVSDAQDNLLNLIGQYEFDTTLGAVSLPSLDNVTVNFTRSYELARDSQPDYVAEENYIKQVQIDVASAKRNRLPELDLDGALGYNTTDHSAGRAINRLPDGDGYSWQLGLSLNIPWGMRADKARYRSAQTTLQREQLKLRQIGQSLMVQVRAAVRAVETNRESVDIAAKATELSEKQYDLEKARFDAGLSTSRLVLQAQDDLQSARVSELQARVNLRKAVSALHQIEGTSLAAYDIPLDDQKPALN
jgi:outer membrane protein TolC